MRQKKLTTAAAVLLAGAAPAILWSSAESEAQTSGSEIACTQTPDCSTLGYTKTANQCPDGGIKCPFDGNKMFCVSGESVDYVYQNTLGLHHVAYSDGTTSASYNANKLAIGLIYYIHPNGKNDHGWMLSLEQFPANTRAEAIKRCAGFSTKGTRAGDWHLPDAAEIMMMSAGNDATNEYTNINNALKKIPGAAQLGSSYNLHYCMSGAADQNKTYLNGSPNCNDRSATELYFYGSSNTAGKLCTSKGGSGTCISMTDNNGYISQITPYTALNKTNIYTDTTYWSMSDQTGSSNYIYGNLSSTTGWGSAGSASAKYGHYRCVANF
jgi:hypothetical protein